MRWVVVVPVKPAADGKTRLAGVLSASARERLVRAMALDTIAAALATPGVVRVVVVTADVPLRTLLAQSVDLVDDPGGGLNARDPCGHRPGGRVSTPGSPSCSVTCPRCGPTTSGTPWTWRPRTTAPFVADADGHRDDAARGAARRRDGPASSARGRRPRTSEAGTCDSRSSRRPPCAATSTSRTTWPRWYGSASAPRRAPCSSVGACASTVVLAARTWRSSSPWPATGAGSELGLHPPTLTMRAAPEQGSDVDGTWWFPCANRLWDCNWLAAADSGSGQCVSCRLTRTRPRQRRHPRAGEAGRPRRRQASAARPAADLGLPITPWYEREGGLGFDLLSSRSDGARVTHRARQRDRHHRPGRVPRRAPRGAAGRARRAVPHDARALPARDRALLRVDPGRADGLDHECRTIFGDERTSYRDAICTGTTGPGRRGLGGRATSPSTPRCTRGRTSRSASPTTCT